MGLTYEAAGFLGGRHNAVKTGAFLPPPSYAGREQPWSLGWWHQSSREGRARPINQRSGVGARLSDEGVESVARFLAEAQLNGTRPEF
jgi:hypothetical protein